MSDFEAFAEEIEDGMSFLSHHQILGAKWGVMNGPPYPLGSGDHSSSEKQAAAAAGVKVGKDSGKGSIENVKPRSKSPQTDEEKREAALDAARKGDKKKIAKYMDYLTREELQEAENRARIKDSMTRQEPGEKKMSKADVDKMEAIRSGDKEKVKEFADQMSYAELQEAMNKVDLTKRLNYTAPPPTLSDKIDKVVNKIEQVRNWAEKGIAAYNTLAKVYNSTHPDSEGWPEITPNSKAKKKEQEVAAKLANQAKNDVKKELSDKEKAKQNLEKKKIDYEYDEKYNKWKAEQEADKAKAAEKEAKKEMARDEKDAYKENAKRDKEAKAKYDNDVEEAYAYNKKFNKDVDDAYAYNKKLNDERLDRDWDSAKEENTRRDAQAKKTQELLEQGRKYDDYIMKNWDSASKTRLDDDDVSYDSIFSDSYKQQMRNESFERAMQEVDYENLYNYAMRHKGL